MSTDQRGVSGTSATPKGNILRVAWALLRIHESAISFDGVTQCRLPPTRDRVRPPAAGPCGRTGRQEIGAEIIEEPERPSLCALLIAWRSQRPNP
jgi:hypothetical protein